GSQATSLLIRALALTEVRLGQWRKVLLRELLSGLSLGLILGTIGMLRITVWQHLGFTDYGEHWLLVALTVGLALAVLVLGERLRRDAALHPQAAADGPGDVLGAIRGDAGGRDRAGDLLHHGTTHPERHGAVA